MKNNKFFLIFSIIFFLQGINIAAGEEIIFEASQINLYENGTLIKANKGKAIIDNNNEIIENVAESTGGGMYLEISSSPILMNVEVRGNTAEDNGGGIHVIDSNWESLVSNGSHSFPAELIEFPRMDSKSIFWKTNQC